MADLLSQLATAVNSALSGSPLRYDSDYRVDLQKIQMGVKRFQIRGAVVGKQFDSNNTMQVARVELAVHFGISTTERAYTEGQMQTELETFLSLAWWRAIAAVHDVIELPEASIDRVGNVISYTVRIDVSIDP
jgi:hypothetical protein